MPKIFSVTNRKGGTGKSTATILLATTMASEGKKVLVLDCDNQRSIEKLRQVDEALYEREAPYQVEGLQARFIFDYIKLHGANYDFIFIDLPRFTSAGDGEAMQTLSFCDGILIPVLGSSIEILSASDFLKAIQELAEFKENNNIEFKYYGFLNRMTRRKENKETMKYMEQNGLPMFDRSLKDLKLFANPSTYESILDGEGRSRFYDFYQEFKRKFKI